MKATKLVTSAAVAVLGFTLIAPTVLAESPAGQDLPKQLTGNADITYTEDTTTNPPVDPEIPTDPVTPPGPVNPEGGPISVDFVSDLHFGTQSIQTAKGVYNAAEAKTKNSKDEEIKRGNWVQVTDKRSIGKDGPAGWTLKAQLTQQFKNADNNELKGATLTYTNPVVTSKTDQSGTIAGITPVGNVELSYDAQGTSSPMATAEKGSGFGTYFIQYGREAGFGGVTEENKTSGESIKLTVPEYTPLAASQYNAKITWTIEEL